ncbi:amidohydrolase family protein [Tahibacter harae]|uniref:Amidohydrolase n=1 Tax=Tahibacter harae TaxID=2963937 RepID=A0ABT1QT64_9GAMM|nr:amidohydrolase family protein [Tahibacter harae]MCQ4165485.1 amidohydrolase [Tahibacter harae]
MKRREFVVASASLAQLALLQTACRDSMVRCTAPPPVYAHVVDAHCHVFNGSDLAQERFIKVVLLKHYPRQAVSVLDIEDEDVLDGFVKLLTRLVGRTRTPNADAEIQVLDREARPQPGNADPAQNESLFIDALAGFVGENGLAVAADEGAAGLRKVRGAIFRAAGEDGIAVSSAEVEPAAAREVAAKAYRSKYDLGVLLRWFSLFTRYRYSLAEQLAADLRCQGMDARLLCPATVDFDHWLGQFIEDGPYQTPLPRQIRVMGRIARRAKGPVVHGYVAFDPLRKAIYDVSREGFDPLELVRSGIQQEGFIGVKMYPPMGFRAFGNGTAPAQTYPKPAVERLEQAIAQSTAQADEATRRAGQAIGLGRRLDTALAQLYDYCASQGVCILAHANNSNGSGDGYGARADPAFWLDVFARWPTLPVMLAHFGNFEFVSQAAPPGATGNERTWEWTLGRHFRDHPDAPVFADFSYLSEVVHKSPQELDAYAATFRAWIAAFDPDCRHIVFGTDWIMLGVDAGYADYARSVYAFFRDRVGLGAEPLRRIFELNAGRFLGLREGDSSRRRLLDFYAAHRLPASRLPVFAAG